MGKVIYLEVYKRKKIEKENEELMNELTMYDDSPLTKEDIEELKELFKNKK